MCPESIQEQFEQFDQMDKTDDKYGQDNQNWITILNHLLNWQGIHFLKWTHTNMPQWKMGFEKKNQNFMVRKKFTKKNLKCFEDLLSPHGYFLQNYLRFISVHLQVSPLRIS